MRTHVSPVILVTHVICFTTCTATASDTTGAGGLSTGGKIGVSIGVPGGLVTFILSTLGGLTCCRKKRKRNTSNDTESGGADNQGDTQEKRWSLKNGK